MKPNHNQPDGMSLEKLEALRSLIEKDGLSVSKAAKQVGVSKSWACAHYTKLCACGCGTVIPGVGERGYEVFWAKGHQHRKPKSELYRHQKVTLDASCQVCGRPIIVSKRTVKKAFRTGRSVCSAACNTEIARRAIDQETRASMTAKLRERLANDPRWQPGREHIRVMKWSLKSPQNVIYEFVNLRMFIIEHQNLFLPADTVWTTRRCRAGQQMGMCRAMYGLSGLNPDRSVSGLSWKGWTWHHPPE